MGVAEVIEMPANTNAKTKVDFISLPVDSLHIVRLLDPFSKIAAYNLLAAGCVVVAVSAVKCKVEIVSG